MYKEITNYITNDLVSYYKEFINYIFHHDLVSLYCFIIIILLAVILRFKSWFSVDKRILGIYRIFLGILIFSDIFRRWDVRHIFYSSDGIVSHSGSSVGYNKSLSLLHTFNGSFEISVLFIIGMVFSLLLILGYKTKLSHFIAGIILISIHNKVTLVENAGDFVLNCMIVWTFFLPLGSAISLDSLKKSLSTYKENNPDDLNKELPYNHEYSSLAYFAILFQIAAVYFFTGLNKNGVDWTGGTAVHYFYQLDTFLTPIGAFLRAYIGETFAKVSTYGTLVLEFATPLLLFIPWGSKYLRLIAVLILTIFHLTISASLSIGLFSQTMIISFILLIDGQFIDWLKSYFKNQNKKKYILFYDSDCGFCHYTARIIKRLDIFKKIKFKDQHSKTEISGFKSLITKTAIVYDPNTGKQWTRHHAFAKIISCLPLGIIISWIFYIPGINQLFGEIYDVISHNRTKISSFFGLPVCDIQNKQSSLTQINQQQIPFNNYMEKFKYIISSLIVFILLLSAFNYNLAANKSVNEYMEKYGFEKNNYIKKIKPLMNYTRMIQRWDMFSPNVLKTDKWIIVEAYLSNGERIDPFTGNAPVLNSVEYEILWKDINQFWRKYFGRIITKQGKPKLKHVKKFDKWVRTTDYFNEQIGDGKIKSIKIWYLTQRNPKPGTKTENKVRKRLIYETPKHRSSTKRKKTKTYKKTKGDNILEDGNILDKVKEVRGNNKKKKG